MPKLQLAPQPRERGDVIIVGSDLSGASDAALSYALLLAGALGARLIAVHITEHIELKKRPHKPLVRNDLLALQRLIKAQKAAAEQQLAKQLRRAKAPPDEAVLEVHAGKPSRDLLAVAQKKRAILVVLGAGDRGAGLGHVALRVLQGSHVPVVVVPPSRGKGAERRTVPKAKLHLVPKPALRRVPPASEKAITAIGPRSETKDERAKRRSLERWENEGGPPPPRRSGEGLKKP